MGEACQLHFDKLEASLEFYGVSCITQKHAAEITKYG